MSEIRMFYLGYPKADLGHGSVWATTAIRGHDAKAVDKHVQKKKELLQSVK